ncbi:hypothetical protein P4O66_011891 [Electrophorus voltai]|uniref:Uncharacterized protein n=1 Tax=Electrophorus voltai TaxID=2609070 RepID=A0AAD8Z6J0_9TELE|nr:hypothetical protein P4O66_011891 [Electrophorus voltai]
MPLLTAGSDVGPRQEAWGSGRRWAQRWAAGGRHMARDWVAVVRERLGAQLAVHDEVTGGGKCSSECGNSPQRSTVIDEQRVTLSRDLPRAQNFRMCRRSGPDLITDPGLSAVSFPGGNRYTGKHPACRPLGVATRPATETDPGCDSRVIRCASAAC